MNGNILFYSSLLLCVAGVFISRLLVLHVIDRNNPQTTKWCSISGKFNCNVVLTSPFSRIGRYTHLADIALVYYLTALLIMLLSLVNGYTPLFLAVSFFPSTILFAFTIVLLLYQSFIIKSWCRLCLLLTGVIWLQQLIEVLYIPLVNSLSDVLDSDKLMPLIATAFIGGLISCSWLIVKPYILKAKKAEQVQKQMIKWKSNPNLFNTLLKQQRLVEIALWDDDFILGNPKATMQLTTAFNPYCPACSYEYRILKEILKQYDNNIGITVKFRVNTVKKSTHTEAVEYLLHEYFSEPTDSRIAILEKWFDKHDLKQLREKYGNLNEQYNELMLKHEQWFKDAQITHTPTLFVNGYEFPQPYNLSDFKVLLPKLIRSEKKQEQPVT